MRNLKRALSLLLAAAMLIGMMVVGASAAGSLDDFSDKDEIVNQDAVSLLTILGVIEGKEDGSFYDPTGNVTRAEMAKMIATILNQGADIDGLYVGMNTGLTDVSGHWAESYINYCYSLGIIAGRGDGTFDPGATVTGTEAAKMLLVAAGYDASIEGLTGADWAIRTAALASTLGIFDNLTAPTGDPLNRDNAALLVYNALDIEMIQSYRDGYAIAYGDNRTLLSTKYGVYRIEGVVVGNEWAQLENTDSDAALAAGKTRLSEVVLIDSDTVNTIDNTDDGTPQPDTTFNVSTPVEYLGQTVTMYVRNTTVLANSQVLGVYLKDGVNNVLTTAESQDTMKDYLKGTGLNVDGDTRYYVNYGYMSGGEDAATTAMSFESTTGRFTSLNNKTNGYGVEMTVIDNDQDGLADYVLYLQETLSHVISRDDTRETVTLNGFNSNRTIDLSDVVTEAEMAENDLVLAISYGGRYYVSDPEVVTGEMESFQSDKAKEQTITVGGTEYNPSYIQYAADTADNTHEFDIAQCDKDGVQFDTNYDFILDSNGNVIAYQPSEEGLYNYALILNSGYESGAFASDASGKVTVLLPDATEATYTLNFSASARNVGQQMSDWINDVENNTTDYYTTNMGIQQLKAFLGTSDSDNSTTAPWAQTSTGTPVVIGGSDVEKYGFAGHEELDGNTGLAQEDYKDGRAIGYVIGYSLNDDNVLTITSIVGSNTENSVILYDPSDLNGKVRDDYKSGAGRLSYTLDTGVSDRVAIDRNTVAFYCTFDSNGDVDTYGVAVGYSEMSDVDAGKDFVSAYVPNTRDALAGVVLFNAEGVQAEKDYVFVLSRNTVNTNDYAILDVVYEDGTVGQMTIDIDNYDDIFRGNDDAFRMAYAYTTDAKGVSELTAPTFGRNANVASNLQVAFGYAWQLDNGTIALYSDEKGTRRVDTYSFDDQIWYVMNTDGDDTKAPAGAFSENTGREVVLVLDGNGDKVVAAFIERVLTNEGNPGYVGDVRLPDPVMELSAATTSARIREAFDEGYSVLIDDNYTLTADLRIPKGLGLQVTGDLNMSFYDIDSTGILIVDDVLNTGSGTKTLTGTVHAGTLTLGSDTTISGTVSVVNNVETANCHLTINEGHTLNVDGNITSTTGSPYVTTVKGTLKVRGNADEHMVVDSGAVATIDGNMTGNLIMNAGAKGVTIGGNYTGDVGLNGGALTVEGDLTQTASDIVVDATRSLDVGGSLTSGGDLTLDDGVTVEIGKNLTVVDLTINDGSALYVGGLKTVSGTETVNDGTVEDSLGSTTKLPAGASVSAINEALAAAGDNGVVELNANLSTGTYNIPSGTTLDLTGNVSSGVKFTGGGTLNVAGNIADSEDVATVAALPTTSGVVNLEAPNVVIGTHTGTIGSGTLLFNANTCDGQALYQFDFSALPGWSTGTSSVDIDSTGLPGTTMTGPTDLIGLYEAVESHTIEVDIDGDSTVDYTFRIVSNY